MTSREKAWLRVLEDAYNTKALALFNRNGKNFGIGVDEDLSAIRYRIADHRLRRAKYALNPIYSIDGLISSSTFDKDGWHDDTEKMHEESWRHYREEGKKLRVLREKVIEHYKYEPFNYGELM